MLDYLVMGTVLGLSAGFAPGPLLTLVISETLRHDRQSGIKVALAPLITDLPIIIIAIFILDRLSQSHNILGVISITGGFFLIYLGYENIRTKGIALNLQEKSERSLSKGVVANFLSPHPYLFWLSVGGPLITKSFSLDRTAPFVFIGSFYICLIGAKILIAFLAGKSRSFLDGAYYLFTIRLLGFILLGLAGFLFQDGIRLLGLLQGGNP